MKGSTLLTGILLSISLFSQNLESVWQDYNTTGARLSLLRSEIQKLVAEKDRIRAEDHDLKANSTWYNSWLNKLILSGNTEDQLQIIDDIKLLEDEMKRLQEQHRLERDQLKDQYARIVADYEAGGRLSAENRSTVERVGQVLSQVQRETIDLPDYSDFLTDVYASPTLRRLVLQDLSTLLTEKLGSLDSLIKKDRDQAELAARLNAFQEDLGLQMEAGQDVQERDESGEPTKNYSWESTSELAFDAAVGAGSPDKRLNTGESVVLTLDHAQDLSSGSETQSRGTRSHLELKRSEYEILLQKILLELNTAE